MTRFEQEISGALGAYWKREAEKELVEIADDIANGRITIDENGVARNCIGRVLMSDMAEKVAYLTNDISVEATKEARAKEVAEELKDYKERPLTFEERAEMRNAFGKGATVVNVLTGRIYTV